MVGRDAGLQARMLLTMFLLGLLYVAFIGVLFAAGAGAITIAVVRGGLLLLQFFTSDKLALRSMGAREVSPQEAPELHAMIERLCVQADLPKPRVAIAETSMPNAFALGRSPKKATVCATTGIMDLLSPAELEGVMAHELTHVANRDVAIMTLRQLLRLAGLDDPPVRLLLRRRRRRRGQRAGFFAIIAVVGRRLRDLVLPHAARCPATASTPPTTEPPS